MSTPADPRKATLRRPELAVSNGAPVQAPAATPEPPKKPKPPRQRSNADWPAVELDYRAGILTLRAMQKKHGVSGPGIIKHAKEHGWVRDLTAKINQRAEDLVNRQMVSSEVSKTTLLTERALIESVAQAQVRVLNEQRSDIGNARGLFRTLIGRFADEVTVDQMNTMDLALAAGLTLDAQDEAKAFGVEESNAKAFQTVLERVGRDQFRGGKSGRDPVNDLYHQIISTPGRIKAMKEVSEVLKNLVALEREAYRIDKMPDDTGSSGRTSLPVRFVEVVRKPEGDDDE